MIQFVLTIVFASTVLLIPAAITFFRNVRDCSASVVVPKIFSIFSIGAMLSVVMTFTSHFQGI
jgi:hypothetical protein